MARFVKVASIPGGQLRVTDSKDYEACVQEELAYWQRQLDHVTPDQPDLIVTPECCDRPAGLSRDDRLAYYQVRGERLFDFFCAAAKRHNANIAYAAVRGLPDGSYRNSIQFINRNGEVDGIYNKYLLVIEEYTQGKILYGKDIEAIRTDVGRVCGAICFDLNFDEPLKKTAAQKPEILVFSSAYHGGIMQAHWAYMCRSYMITAINGTETANVINPVGEVIAESSNYYRYLSTRINLDYVVAHLDHNWARFDAMKRKYGDAVEIRTPFGLGCSLLTCQDPNHTMEDIVREFEIERWDDYYARSMAARYEPGRIEE
ncbi:MAG TPA: carbon-nitrogen hydrolase family protein [Clostridia bacterium]|nr:carbon-nitrogen hydrolase family protein [Clostridia bacterium]